MNPNQAWSWALPVEVQEMVAAQLGPTSRGVLKHVSRECRAGVRAVVETEGAVSERSPPNVSCRLQASWLVRSLYLTVWATAQECPWTPKQWLEKSACESEKKNISERASLFWVQHITDGCASILYMVPLLCFASAESYNLFNNLLLQRKGI
jgi:hypothetical protein